MTNIIIISHNSWAPAKPASKPAHSQPGMTMLRSMFSAGPGGCKEKDCHRSPFFPPVSLCPNHPKTGEESSIPDDDLPAQPCSITPGKI